MELVWRTASARVVDVTVLDWASAFDWDVAVVGEGISIIVGQSAHASVRDSVAIQPTESIAIVEGRCGRSA